MALQITASAVPEDENPCNKCCIKIVYRLIRAIKMELIHEGRNND